MEKYDFRRNHLADTTVFDKLSFMSIPSERIAYSGEPNIGIIESRKPFHVVKVFMGGTGVEVREFVFDSSAEQNAFIFGLSLSGMSFEVVSQSPQIHPPLFTHQLYGVCKHGGPGVGFPCEKCRK